jgi:hypothetical protein
MYTFKVQGSEPSTGLQCTGQIFGKGDVSRLRQQQHTQQNITG